MVLYQVEYFFELNKRAQIRSKLIRFKGRQFCCSQGSKFCLSHAEIVRIVEILTGYSRC